jgi:hypothetical protein
MLRKLGAARLRRVAELLLFRPISQTTHKDMKYLIAILLLTICNVGQAQRTVLKTDTTLAIPQLSFDPNGELKITASPTSSQSDFDFLVGKWKMHNRRLNKRLEDCKRLDGI